MKRLKAGPGGVEIEYFDEVLADAKHELTAAKDTRPTVALPGASKAEAEGDAFIAEMTRLAEVSPSAAILESYARFEGVLREAVEGQGQGVRPMSVRGLARTAVERGLLAETELTALDDVAVIRNLIAHGQSPQIDKERALEYVSIIRQLMLSIYLAQGKTVLDEPRPPAE